MKLDLTPVLPLLPWLGWALALLLAWLWLRPALTPAWVAQLLESEGVPSVRLVLAAAVVVFTLAMQAADRLSAQLVDANLTFAGVLLGLGTLKVTASRFAPKPVTDPTEQPETPNQKPESTNL